VGSWSIGRKTLFYVNAFLFIGLLTAPLVSPAQLKHIGPYAVQSCKELLGNQDLHRAYQLVDQSGRSDSAENILGQILFEALDLVAEAHELAPEHYDQSNRTASDNGTAALYRDKRMRLLLKAGSTFIFCDRWRGSNASPTAEAICYLSPDLLGLPGNDPNPDLVENLVALAPLFTHPAYFPRQGSAAFRYFSFDNSSFRFLLPTETKGTVNIKYLEFTCQVATATEPAQCSLKEIEL
jgi:hypothetical protein